MSEFELPDNICPTTWKVIHHTKNGAMVAKKIAKDRSLDAYLCSACNGWHTGHPQTPKKRRIKVRR